MKYSVMFAAAALALGASGLSAQACNPLGAQGAFVARMDVPASMLARNNPNAPQKDSAVGLWHVFHTMSNGSLLFEGFDIWHNDGTEEEIANLPPATGPICFGVWAQNGSQFQLLYHTTFTYDLNNNFTGTIVLTETNKLAKDGNSYKGSFEFKQFDPNGNLVADITGTSKADRLNGG
jgi:hypothetical protein